MRFKKQTEMLKRQTMLDYNSPITKGVFPLNSNNIRKKIVQFIIYFELNFIFDFIKFLISS